MFKTIVTVQLSQKTVLSLSLCLSSLVILVWCLFRDTNAWSLKKGVTYLLIFDLYLEMEDV